MTAYFRLLAQPMQRRLLAASIPADFADWLDYVAVVALLVYTWNEGPFALALFALALTLPYVLVGPLLAAYVDRADIRNVMVLSNIGRAVATLALILAPHTLVVLLLVFLRSSIDSAFTPARQAALQALTPAEQLNTANGLHQAINQVSKIAGPALGGVLLVLLPTGAVFAVNALLSLLAAGILLFVRIPARPAPAATSETFRSRLTAGIGEFGRSRRMLAALVFAAAAYFAFFLYDTLIALLAAGFGFDAAVYGFSITASGLGGLVGALAAGALPHSRPLLVMSASALVSGPVTIAIASLALAGASLHVGLFYLAMAIMGGSTAFMLVPYRTIIQADAPPDRIARVYAAGEAITMAVMLSAPFLGSFVAHAYGTGAAFLCGGVLIVVIGLAGLVAGLRR